MIIVYDDREKLPYTFKSRLIKARLSPGERIGRRRARLDCGDYTLYGKEALIRLERKSLADLFHTIGQGRNRFKAELASLARYPSAAVIIEATPADILNNPPRRSKVHPNAIIGACLSWSCYFRVPFFFAEDRDHAELIAFILFNQAVRRVS